jgi:PKD domain-containing protein
MRRIVTASLVALVACSDKGPPAAPSPGGGVQADLRLNSLKSGTFGCTQGLFFSASVANATGAPVQVDSFALTFERVSGPWCSSHAAPMTPGVNVSVAPGSAAEVRRVDLAGDLCAAPNGDAGCEWIARASLSTSAGPLLDQIAFSTATPSGAAPTPAPTAGPGNNAPTVTLHGGGSCHPSIRRPCTVEFTAEASDPDGDRVALTWSDCASGSGPRATCTVRTPETYTARVDATDGRGGYARAFATAQGTNQPPRVRFGTPRPPDPARSNTFYGLTGGQPEDPDGDEDSNALCRQGTTVTASGPCRAGLALCGGVGDAFDVDIHTLDGPGTCVVEAQVRDSWGAVGTDRLEFRVR